MDEKQMLLMAAKAVLVIPIRLLEFARVVAYAISQAAEDLCRDQPEDKK